MTHILTATLGYFVARLLEIRRFQKNEKRFNEYYQQFSTTRKEEKNEN